MSLIDDATLSDEDIRKLSPFAQSEWGKWGDDYSPVDELLDAARDKALKAVVKELNERNDYLNFDGRDVARVLREMLEDAGIERPA